MECLTNEQIEKLKKMLRAYTCTCLYSGSKIQFDAGCAELVETGMGEMGEISDMVDELVNDFLAETGLPEDGK